MHESEGKYELETVIRQSGFASRSVFYDAFLRVKGVSPNRYLEQENERWNKYEKQFLVFKFINLNIFLLWTKSF